MSHLIPLLFVFTALGPDGSAADWPHWRGVNRDGHTAEISGWEEGAWPLKHRLWEAHAGEGCSSVAVSGAQVFAIGWDKQKRQDAVTCHDAATGKVVWTQTYGAPQYGRQAKGDQGFFSGPSATPEIDAESNLLFTIGCDGELRAWDTSKKGELRWRLNLYDKFDIPMRPQVTTKEASRRDYGFTSAPMVLGDRLLVEAGDPNRGTVLALDKRTGRQRWWSEQRDPAGHAGAMVPMTVSGVPCVLVFTALHVLVMRVDAGNEGKTVGTVPWVTHYANNIATPAIIGSDAIVTTAWNDKTARLRFAIGKPVETVWESRQRGNVCSPVVVGKHVYWIGRAGLSCQDAGSGNVLWTDGKFGDASSLIATADDRLIVWANDGDLALVEGATRSGGSYRELAAMKKVGRDMAWPHVVLAGGRLICKDRSGRMVCYAIQP